MERQAVEEHLRAVADSLGLLDYVPEATAGAHQENCGL
jgi:hypothetical protein